MTNPFAQGDGNPDCPKCQGRGVTPVMVELPGGVQFPGGGTQRCDCVYKRDLLANVRKIWKLLPNGESIPTSPLMKWTEQSLWVRASHKDIVNHLRHVALRMGPAWYARVMADAALVTAWLSTAHNIRDPDVLIEQSRMPSSAFYTLVDIALPPDLLIILLGVKSAKNREMPGVLAEAISERTMAGKPTWIVDSPGKKLGPGHICWDVRVEEVIWEWPKLQLTRPKTKTTTKIAVPSSGGTFRLNMDESEVAVPEVEEEAETLWEAEAEDDGEDEWVMPGTLTKDDRQAEEAKAKRRKHSQKNWKK